MKSNLAIVSVTLAFAVSSRTAPAPSGVKHHALPSDTAAIVSHPGTTSPALNPSSGPDRPDARSARSRRFENSQRPA